MPAGYSGTPLADKLTLKDGMCVWFDSMPDSVHDAIENAGLDLEERASPDDPFDAAHIFVTTEASLTSKLCDLAQHVARDGQIWVSWPKKGSGTESEVDENAVRAAGLDCGMVDTKKCAVDEIWAGLKFVFRKEDR